MAAHIRAGDTVYVAILAQGLASRGAATEADFRELQSAARVANSLLGVNEISFAGFPDNEMDTISLLSVIRHVEGLIAGFRPDIVYTQYAGDLNVDHRRVSEAVVTACRPQPGHCVETILFFEVPSSTEWQIGAQRADFSPNWFNDISGTLGAKMRALRAYSGEMREWPHPRSAQAVEHLARWRGATVGVQAAEAFVLGRRLVRVK